MKEVQAMPEDPGHFLRFDSLEYSGKIYPFFEKKIEFIGDSITSGGCCRSSHGTGLDSRFLQLR